MVLIFSASADRHSSQHTFSIVVPLLHWLFPHMPDSQVETIHHFLRKCAHFSEYAILALLLRRTLLNALKAGTPPWSGRLVAGVVGLVFIYASSDEYHQSFVPGRTPLFSDVMIDTAGGMAGLLVGWLCHRFWKKLGRP